MITKMSKQFAYAGLLLTLSLIFTACNSAANQRATAAEPAETGQEKLLFSTEDTQPIEIERDPNVPPLPFPDNPDPALCGIPQPWNSDAPAYLSGVYQGQLVQPVVFLYDSHLRRSIQASAPHGAQVKIILSQSNPQLNYFMVKILDADPPNEGWVPAPFVTFEPPPPAESFETAAIKPHIADF